MFIALLTSLLIGTAHAGDTLSAGFRSESYHADRFFRLALTATTESKRNRSKWPNTDYDDLPYWQFEGAMIIGHQAPALELKAWRRNVLPEYRFALNIEQPLKKASNAVYARPQGSLEGDLILPYEGNVFFFTGWRGRYAHLRWDPVWDRYAVGLEEHFFYLGIEGNGDKHRRIRLTSRAGLAVVYASSNARPVRYLLPHTTLALNVEL